MSVFSLIKINKKVQIEQQYIQEIASLAMETLRFFLLSLEKDRDVVIGGTRPKSRQSEPSIVVGENKKFFRIQRGEGLDNISLILNQDSRQEQTQQKEE